MTSEAPSVGDRVVCADGEELGLVDGDEGTHLRVRRQGGATPFVWVPKTLIDRTAGGEVHLLLPRDDLHDGVIALSPSRQREYGTLEALAMLVRRVRAGRPA